MERPSRRLNHCIAYSLDRQPAMTALSRVWNIGNRAAPSPPHPNSLCLSITFDTSPYSIASLALIQ